MVLNQLSTRLTVKRIVFFLIGIIMFLGSFHILSWNELRAVEHYKRVHEVNEAVLEISAADVPSIADGELVYVNGRARTRDVLEDPVFGISVADSIKLRRVVEMLQWEEVEQTERRRSAGSSSSSSRTYTTYSYRLVWSQRQINSNRFHTRDPSKQNPDSMRFEGVTVSASNIELGAFQVDPAVTSQIEQYEPLELPLDTLILPSDGYVDDDRYIFIRQDRNEQQVGDLRISFASVPADELSIISGLQGNLLNQSWEDSAGQPYSRAYRGIRSKESMIEDAQNELRGEIWLGRGVSVILMLSGLFFMTTIRQFFNQYRVARGITNLGVIWVCGLISIMLPLLIIACIWASVRPVMSGCLVLVACSILLLFYQLKRLR